MSHIFRDKARISNRINRIKGQLDSVAKMLDKEENCLSVLQTLSASRGALNGLLGEIIDGHIRYHIKSSPDADARSRDKAADELIRLLKTYWK